MLLNKYPLGVGNCVNHIPQVIIHHPQWPKQDHLFYLYFPFSEPRTYCPCLMTPSLVYLIVSLICTYICKIYNVGYLYMCFNFQMFLCYKSYSFSYFPHPILCFLRPIHHCFSVLLSIPSHNYKFIISKVT